MVCVKNANDIKLWARAVEGSAERQRMWLKPAAPSTIFCVVGDFWGIPVSLLYVGIVSLWTDGVFKRSSDSHLVMQRLYYVGYLFDRCCACCNFRADGLCLWFVISRLSKNFVNRSVGFNLVLFYLFISLFILSYISRSTAWCATLTILAPINCKEAFHTSSNIAGPSSMWFSCGQKHRSTVLWETA